jgi:AcrR family transcriptional regulator
MTRVAEDPSVAVASVPAELVQAALRAADELGRQVADVPSAAIAARAGMSRSTLLRRLGGSRSALDDAVRATGVDPGGQPVRVRALDAAAELVSASGVGVVTMEDIAERANCSVDSLYAVFGGRTELLAAVFERHAPMLEIADILDSPRGDLTDTVRRVYAQLAETLNREPRVAPAMLAETLARPTSQAVLSVKRHSMPRLLAVLGQWLTAEIQAGRIRELPLPLLIQQFLAPTVMHLLLRPALVESATVTLPEVDQACDFFAEAFVRAVSTGRAQQSALSPHSPPVRRSTRRKSSTAAGDGHSRN